MAELIERSKLLKALATSREYHAESCREQNLLIRAEIIVREQPTTTEADIRASAYEEVFELLRSKRDKKTMRVNLDDLEIRKYMEQLKEG